MIINREKIDTAIENQITTAMILSTRYLTEIFTLYEAEYMVNPYAKVICAWCIDYYKVHGKAPQETIRDIYELEKGYMSDADAQIVSAFLSKISREYVSGQSVNDEYALKESLSYFNRRNITVRAEKALRLLDLDRHEEAQQVFTDYKQVSYQLSGWFNPYDPQGIWEVFDPSTQGILQLPGAVGEIVGPIEREWFVALLGPFKRGKTFALMKMARWAVDQRLKVAFFSLEMKKKNIKERFARDITGYGVKNGSGEEEIVYPVFDCIHNQSGECNRPERTNQESLVNVVTGYTADSFNRELTYRACTACRGQGRLSTFKQTVWFETAQVPAFDFRNTFDFLKSYEEIYGSENLKVIPYPRFKASLDDIERDLFSLEVNTGFIPDVIIIDYADILLPNKSREGRRFEVDDIWKLLPAMASERKCIVISASQGNRDSVYSDALGQDDIAEWIGKFAHVDIFLCLNQTPEEKRKNLLRLGMLAHRHKDFDEERMAMIVQQLRVGQFWLDSEVIRYEIDREAKAAKKRR
jgi:hypothetical protein